MASLEEQLPPGWIGYYTKKGGVGWFWCRIIAHDAGEIILRTSTGRVHNKDPGEFQFMRQVPPDGVKKG